MIAGEENNDGKCADKQDIREPGVGERKEMGYHGADRQDQYVYHHIIAMGLNKYQEQRESSNHDKTEIDLTHTDRISITGGDEMETADDHQHHKKAQIYDLRDSKHRVIGECRDIKQRTQVT